MEYWIELCYIIGIYLLVIRLSIISITCLYFDSHPLTLSEMPQNRPSSKRQPKKSVERICHQLSSCELDSSGTSSTSSGSRGSVSSKSRDPEISSYSSDTELCPLSEEDRTKGCGGKTTKEQGSWPLCKPWNAIPRGLWGHRSEFSFFLHGFLLDPEYGGNVFPEKRVHFYHIIQRQSKKTVPFLTGIITPFHSA